MKILVMSDIHQKWSRFPVEEMPPADMVLVAGDITDYGMRVPGQHARGVRFMDELYQKYKTLYWVRGNHDLGVSHCDYAGLNVEPTRGVLHDEKTFVYGASLSPCFNVPDMASRWQHMTARESVDALYYDNLRQEIQGEGVFSLGKMDRIILSHCPPYKCLDTVYNKPYPNAPVSVAQNIGSPGLRHVTLLTQPRLIVCGHVHEGATGGFDGDGVDYVEKTVVVNTALAWRMIYLDEPLPKDADPGDVSITEEGGVKVAKADERSVEF